MDNGHTLHLVARQPSQPQPSSGTNSGETTTDGGNRGNGFQLISGSWFYAHWDQGKSKLMLTLAFSVRSGFGNSSSNISSS